MGKKIKIRVIVFTIKITLYSINVTIGFVFIEKGKFEQIFDDIIFLKKITRFIRNSKIRFDVKDL